MSRALTACGGALLLVAFLAFLHLPYPFSSDQALFSHFAQAMDGGARLYSDLWDIKQPGLFGLYWLGGRLFGFDPVGIHAFDLLWMVAIAATVAWIASQRTTAWMSAAAPLFCLGPFYAVAQAFHLTQAEMLAGLPIALIVGLVAPSVPRRLGLGTRNALAAACVVAVALIKFVLVAIPLAILLAAWLHAVTTRELAWRALLRSAVLPATLGGLIALGVAAAVLSAMGILGSTVWVTFVVPPYLLETLPPAPRWRLRMGAEWFAASTLPLLPLAIVGGVREALLRRSAFGWMLAAWVLSAALVIVVQRTSWWPYHFDLFFVPIGLLAATGLDACRELAQRRFTASRIPDAIAAALCALVLIPSVLLPAAREVREFWSIPGTALADPARFSDQLDAPTRQTRASSAFLHEAASRPGRIAIFGDGRLFQMSGRDAVLTINGGAPFPAAQIERAARALEEERPVYVYLNELSWKSFSGASDAVLRILERDYVLHSRDERRGSWCERRTGSAAAADAPACPVREIARLGSAG